MILESFKGQMFLNGKIIDNKQCFYLIPSNHQEYSFEKDQCNVDNERQYIKISEAGIMINTSWFGELPLFYFTKDDYFVVSSSFERLLLKLKEKHLDALDFDRTAIFESMIFDNPLRARTLFKNISKTLPGKKISINAMTLNVSEESTFILPFDKGSADFNKKHFLDEATEILKKLSMSFASFKTGEVLLPLSGGLDSRLLACLLSKNNIPYSSITFGPKESTEPYIAKKVAKQLDIPIVHLELKNDYYRTYGDAVTWLTGGLSSPMHCHLYAVLSANQVYSDNIVHGYLGGEYAGSSQPEHACNYSMSEDDALHSFIVKYLAPKWVWSQLSTKDKDAIINDLKEIMTENCQCNLPCHFEEYVHNVDRQFSLIANIFSPIEAFGHVIRPFASKEYAIFFNSLPYELRKDRRLFVEAATSLFPEVFKIGTQNQIYKSQHFIGKIEKQVSSLMSKLSYESLLITKGKFVIHNPKSFERHRELLQLELNNYLTKSISEISELLDMDITNLGLNSRKNRRQVISQYRVLSLSRFIDGINSNKIGITRRCT